MEKSIYKALFDLYHRDLRLMTDLIYDWCGITVPIQVTNNKIQANISILPQLLSYLSSNLLQSYKIDHDPGYIRLDPRLEWKDKKEEIYKVYEPGYEDSHKVDFHLKISWVSVPLRYIKTERKIDLDKSVKWKIVDRSYINRDIFRSESRDRMSALDYQKLLPLHFAHRKNIPELVRVTLDILPTIDKSIRELEDNNIYIFPKFTKSLADHEFIAEWDIEIIPDTLCIYREKSTGAYNAELPSIRLIISTDDTES